MSVTRVAMLIAGLVIGFVASRRLLPVLAKFHVPDSRSLRVMVTALTTAWLGVAGGVFGTTWDVIPVWVMFVALAGVTTVDLFHYRIPNAIVYPSTAALLGLITLISTLRDNPGAIGQAAAAAGLYGGVMAILHFASSGSLGWGDVKLALPLGLVLGWVGSGYGQSLLAVLLAFAMASLLGAVMGVVVWGIRKWGLELLPDPLADPDYPRPTVFPFAPSMAVAAALSVLAIYAAS